MIQTALLSETPIYSLSWSHRKGSTSPCYSVWATEPGLVLGRGAGVRNYNVGGQMTVWVRRYGRMKGNWVPNLESWLHLGGEKRFLPKESKNEMKCAQDETCFRFLIQLLLYPDKVNDRLTTSREHPPPSSPHSLPTHPHPPHPFPTSCKLGIFMLVNIWGPTASLSSKRGAPRLWSPPTCLKATLRTRGTLGS